MFNNMKNKIIENKNLIIFCLAFSLATNALGNVLQYSFLSKKVDRMMESNKKTSEEYLEEFGMLKQDIDEMNMLYEGIDKRLTDIKEECNGELLETVEKKIDELEKKQQYSEWKNMLPTAGDMNTDNENIKKRMEKTDKHNDVIFDVAYTYGIDPLFVKCILYKESGGSGYTFNENLDENGLVKSVDIGFFQRNFLLKNRVGPEFITAKNFMNYINISNYHISKDGEKEKVDPIRLREDFDYALHDAIYVLYEKEKVAIRVWDSDSKWHLGKAYNGSGKYSDEMKEIYEMFGYDFDTSISVPFYDQEIVMNFHGFTEGENKNNELTNEENVLE
ncbi:MAG: hypothetical protein N4A47_06850 [Clostridia bacterium]|jgi:hypothetical protein|nr:hypothetical protein [Clostridia bacterium]